jgi:hypothetical protein
MLPLMRTLSSVLAAAVLLSAAAGCGFLDELNEPLYDPDRLHEPIRPNPDSEEESIAAMAARYGISVEAFLAIEQLQVRAADTIVPEVRDNPDAYDDIYYDWDRLTFVIVYYGDEPRELSDTHGIPIVFVPAGADLD